MKTGETPVPILLEGVQMVSKFNRTELDRVRILMALYRIEEKKIDLVVSFNIPGLAVDEMAPIDQNVIADFQTLAQSLRIVDFGLFT